MADIYYFEGDIDESQEEEESSITMTVDESAEDASATPDELISPVMKMEKFADSENTYNRQMVARGILETLRTVMDSPEDVAVVISVMCKLTEDIEPSVRAELMEQVPHIAMFCHEYRDRLCYIVTQYLLPVVVKYLTDSNNQVRKTSQAALLVLMEQDLVNKEDVEEQVCPVILQLTEPIRLDDYRTEAAALMSKMAPLVGKEMTERLFLHRFAELCGDSLFHVRKVCAANFGDFCGVVGVECTESVLLPRFSYLCEDEVWGVRKACAEVFMAVSCCCTMESRRNELAPLFLNLLCDMSRWVCMAAFQALGPFISTFANPSITGIYCGESGPEYHSEISGHCNPVDAMNTTQSEIIYDSVTELPTENSSADLDKNERCPSPSQTEGESITEDIPLLNINRIIGGAGDTSVITNSENCEMDLSASDNSAVYIYDSQESGCELSIEEKMARHYQSKNCHGQGDISPQTDAKSKTVVYCNTPNETQVLENSEGHAQLSVSGSQGHLHFHVDNECAFNSFHFWRTPIPDIELDIDIVEGKPTNVHVKAKVHNEDRRCIYSSELSVHLTQTLPDENSKQISGSGDSKGTLSAVTAQIRDLNFESKASLEEQDNNSLTQQERFITETNQKIIQTRIHTASLGTVQDLKSKTSRILGSSVNEAVVTIVNGNVKDVQRSHADLYSPNDKASIISCSPSCSPRVSLEDSSIYVQLESQDIVPQDLLNYYLSMCNQSQAHSVDNEIAHHCAFSLPAVALTLGRRHWPILKDLYETLASDLQWKVRRTLAFSIHELAVILGEDLAAKDLMPVFNGFIKDLDEVRIGVLRHLADFLKFLKSPERREYLPKLSEFLKTDSERNWRFRLELTEQLGLISELYSPTDVRDYIVPIALYLIMDKVAEVRHVALKVMSAIVRELNSSGDPSLVRSFLTDLAEQFAHNGKWIRRQTFACLCSQFVDDRSLPLQQLTEELLRHLIDLSYDPVPNVRLAVARTLSQSIVPIDYYSSHQNPYLERLLGALHQLKADSDRDVRYFANLAPQKLVTADKNQMVPPVC